MQGRLYCLASLGHSSTLICPTPLAKVVKCIMAASSSGCGSDPPSMVMVPSQLITVVKPSSSYGLPEWPNPLFTARPASRADANSFFGAATVPASAAMLPRKVRRFQFERGRIGKLLYLCATAAMQLISSSECPGTPATDTVVLAGPPCGK